MPHRDPFTGQRTDVDLPSAPLTAEDRLRFVIIEAIRGLENARSWRDLADVLSFLQSAQRDGRIGDAD